MIKNGCAQVCPYNTLSGCKKDEYNNGACILSNFKTSEHDEEETLFHCNLKENAELIAKILDADSDNRIYNINSVGLCYHFCPDCGAKIDESEDNFDGKNN